MKWLGSSLRCVVEREFYVQGLNYCFSISYFKITSSVDGNIKNRDKLFKVKNFRHYLSSQCKVWFCFTEINILKLSVRFNHLLVLMHVLRLPYFCHITATTCCSFVITLWTTICEVMTWFHTLMSRLNSLHSKTYFDNWRDSLKKKNTHIVEY